MDTHVKYKIVQKYSLGNLMICQVSTMEGELKNGKFKKSKDLRVAHVVFQGNPSDDRIDAGLKRKIRRESNLIITDIAE